MGIIGGFIFLYYVMQSTAFAADVRLRLATGMDYAPYADPELPGGGVITQVVQRVFEEANYQTEVEYYPWKRAYNRTMSVQNDATFPYAKDITREEHFLYSRPINEINIRFYEFRERALGIKTIEDMRGLTYCQPLGYLTEPELKDYVAKGSVSKFEAKDMPTCFKVLGLGRVDFILANDLVAWESAQAVFGADGFERIKPADEPLRRAHEYLIVSRKHPNGPALIEAFNKAYDKLLGDGTLQEIWTTALGKYAKPAS